MSMYALIYKQYYRKMVADQGSKQDEQTTQTKELVPKIEATYFASMWFGYTVRRPL